MEIINRRAEGWERTQKHLLDMVLDKLKWTRDILQFGAVCHEWHCVFKDNKLRRINSRHRQIPMLVFPNNDETMVYNIVEKKFSATKLSLPRNNKPYSGSSQGWIVDISRNRCVTLYKPFCAIKNDRDLESRCKIKLPRLLCAYSDPNRADEIIEDDDSYYDIDHDVLITSDPIETPDECTIFLVIYCVGVAFFRLTKDTAWTLIDIPRYMPDDVIIYNNQLYGTDSKGVLHSIDFSELSGSSQEVAAPALPSRPPPECWRIIRYVVESNYKTLLHVERIMEYIEAGQIWKTKGFRVYKLDFDTRTWVQLKSIGSDTLFLGLNSSICVNALDYVGCESNCIFFAPDIGSGGVTLTEMGIYHLESEKLEFIFDSTALAKMDTQLPMWVVPTFDAI